MFLTDQLISLVDVCVSHLKLQPHICLLLKPKSSIPKASDEEFDRICAKLDRAVEKVRRLAIKAIDVYTSTPGSLPATFSDVNERLHSLLRAYVACAQLILHDTVCTYLFIFFSFLNSHHRSQTLEALAIQDVLHRSVDTLFVLARVTLKVMDPRTFIPAFELLSQASSILNAIPLGDSSVSPLTREKLDITNYVRCISGAFYNLAGILYQGTRYGNAVPFLLESCTLGEKALSLPRPPLESKAEGRRKEWQQLEEQLFRRWELLGVCYSKNGDRRVCPFPISLFAVC